MSSLDEIKLKAVLVQGDFAFVPTGTDEAKRKRFTVYNMENIEQTLDCYNITGTNDFRMISTNFSEENKYKALFLIERNKDILLESVRENNG